MNTILTYMINMIVYKTTHDSREDFLLDSGPGQVRCVMLNVSTLPYTTQTTKTLIYTLNEYNTYIYDKHDCV